MRHTWGRVVKNSGVILDTTMGDDEVKCLNGIRVLSMLWVILGHSFSTMRHYVGKHRPPLPL